MFLGLTQPSQHSHQNIVKPTFSWVSQTAKETTKHMGFIGYTTKPSHIKNQSNQPIVGFLILLRKWKGRISKLVSSTTEPWTPTQDLAWPPQYLHHPTQGSIPFTATQFPQVVPSLIILFEVCKKGFPTPLYMSMWFLSSLCLSVDSGPLTLLGL